MDDRNLRSRSQSCLLGNRESNSGAERFNATGRRSLHMQHRCAESRYRQAGLGLSGFARTIRTTGMQSKLLCWSMETSTASQRKCSCRASRNGYFFVLDRTNGKSLLTVPFGPVNWSLGVDKQGRPIPNPAKEPAPDGRLIAPDEGGLTNYRSPSFDPKNGLFIVDAHPSWSVYFAKPADGVYGWAGADYDVWGKGVIEAIDYQTGKIRWSHELGTRRLWRRRADNRFRAHLHRRRDGQFSRVGFERWQDALARRLRLAHREFSNHLRTRRTSIRAHEQRRRVVRVGSSRSVKYHPNRRDQ